MKPPLLASLLLLAGAALPAPPDDEVAKKFIGAWRLVSTEQRLADGSTRPGAYGPKGVGYILYTGTHMCALLMNPDRPRTSTPPTDQEVRSAYTGMAAYCGAYEVDAKQGLVIHHVELDKSPNAVGTLRKRSFTFSGNRLILRPVPPLPEGVVEYSLTWERVTASPPRPQP